MAATRNPLSLSPFISKCLHLFKENLDQLKLPDVTSRQFFIELSSADICVCGRPLGDHERKRILSEADQYLGDDISGIVNAIKEDIARESSPEISHADSLDKLLTSGRKHQTDLELLNTDLRELEKKLDESGQAELQDLQNRRDQSNQLLRESLSIIEEITRTPDDELDKDESSVCLAWLERQRKSDGDELARITETVELKNKVDLIGSWLKEARTVARNNVKLIINEECNQRLDRILGASPLRIATIDNHIVLEGQAGASVGQTLAVGYTYLATLLRRGQHEFPLVVDSPAGPLDDIVRREVASMVPDLCEQFIAFMIKTEREDFLPALQVAAKNDISYATIYRNTEVTKTVNLSGVSDDDIVRSPGYTLVIGQPFFEKFKLDEC